MWVSLFSIRSALKRRREESGVYYKLWTHGEKSPLGAKHRNKVPPESEKEFGKKGHLSQNEPVQNPKAFKE